METEVIKGSCEYCGFKYEGPVIMQQGSFPRIRCPHCGDETQNFDNAALIDAMDRVEHRLMNYKKVARFELA